MQIELIQLKNLARTFSGYSFRQAVRDEGQGVRVVHISDFEGLYIEPKALKRTTLQIPESQLLESGDVILSSRGYFKAVVFNSRLPAVASASVLVIRLQTDTIMPEYLAVCLNSAKLQNSLDQTARGSMMRSLRLGDLLELEIPVVGLDKQKLLVKLIMNFEKQSVLLKNRQRVLDGIQTAMVQKQLQGEKQ